MRIIFSRSRHLGSVLIRAGSWWGAWSHCGIVTPDGIVIESVAAKGGVIASDLGGVMRRVSAYEVLDLAAPDDLAGHAWAYSTIGAPYDWGGVLAVPSRQRSLQDPGAWYCSEHCAAALEVAGRRLVRPRVHGIHPDTLHALMWAAGARPVELTTD